MQNQKYKKMALIVATALLLPVGKPTIAEAPAKELTAEQIAQMDSYNNPQRYALNQFDQFMWSYEQFKCLDSLWTQESHWNYKADNPRSTAYGIAQMLGEDSQLPWEQINNGLRYIEHRYDTPCAAWRFAQRHNWY